MKFHDYLDFLENISSRYFQLAAAAFLIFYIIWKKRFFHKKIQNKYPHKKDYFREIGYSALSMLIFALVPFVLLKTPSIAKHTTFYMHIEKYGWAYFFLAFPIMFVMHDAYFYFMHRLMHHKKIFKYFHLVHHHSTNPSPWAAYAFHPLEAFVEVGIFAVFLFTIPVHPTHLALFFLFSIIYNVYGHLGWELYPKKFNRHWLGKWVNTSISHNQHHQYFKGNYGLYTLFWDRLFGTIRADYDKKFEEVKNKKRPLVKTGTQTCMFYNNAKNYTTIILLCNNMLLHLQSKNF